MLKRIMRSKAFQAFFGFIVAAHMVLVKYTTRWTIIGAENGNDLFGTNDGLIMLNWHSRFLMLNAVWKRNWQMPNVLISMSRDGGIVAYTVKFLGLKAVRGSARKKGSTKDKGGAEAMHNMKQALHDGGVVVIMPDGPKGPRQRIKGGALKLSKTTGRPIIPVSITIKNRKVFKSWDKFVFPLPFGKGTIEWGTPVTIPADSTDEEMEAYRIQIENEMNKTFARIDKEMGFDVIEPADAEPAAAT